MSTFAPLLAVVWAQWRTSRNFFTRANKGGVAVRVIMGLLWYGIWVLAAFGEAFVASGRLPANVVEQALPAALFFVFFFWQLFPILLANQGTFLDIRRLLVYPIPPSQLFLLEVVLRVTTGIEMLIVSTGLMIGLVLNPTLPWWSPAPVLLFLVFNLLVSSGIKSLMGRLFQKKGVRELMTVLFLGLILAPQFIATAALNESSFQRLQFLKNSTVALALLPWSVAARIAMGKAEIYHFAALGAWLGLGYLFARTQFDRTLRLEEESGGPTAKREPPPGTLTLLDRFARLPSRVLFDPIGAMVEKDIRTLLRAPRFRLVLMMASTLGAVLWLPQVIRAKGGWLSQNYVAMAALYGMLVIGEVIYWNVFGFERGGAQHWFVTPIPFRKVLYAKNTVAVFFTMLVVTILSLLSFLLPIGVDARQIADAFCAAAVFVVFLMGGGNLTSVYMPRPIDGEQAWKNTSGKTQFLLLFVYPLISIPISMAYLARWATGAIWAYYAVLLVCLAVALCFYVAATATAVEVAERRKEEIIAALSQKEGPITIST